MSNAAEERSGLPLLTIYTVLVIAGMTVAIFAYLTLSRVAPTYGDIVFIVLLLFAIVGTWPISTWIEDKFANR